MAIVNIIDPFDIDIDQGQIFNSLLDGSCDHEGIRGELRRWELGLEMKRHIDAALIGRVVVATKAALSGRLGLGQVESITLFMGFHA